MCMSDGLKNMVWLGRGSDAKNMAKKWGQTGMANVVNDMNDT